METSLYQIKFIDGRMFKVFCANKKQKERFIKSLRQFERGEVEDWHVKTNGIHDIKQWEQIAKTL